MSCDVGEVTESLESLHLRHSSFRFSKLSITSPTSQLILQPFRRFIYVTNSFSNPFVASPTLQFILQPFFRFSYITGFFTYVTWRAVHALYGQFLRHCFYKMVLNLLVDGLVQAYVVYVSCFQSPRTATKLIMQLWTTPSREN